MPLCYWATQTMAASALLKTGDKSSTFRDYLNPISAATRIQHAYHHYSKMRPCHCTHPKCLLSLLYPVRSYFLPLLYGNFTSMPGSKLYTDKYASELNNDSYCSTLPQMYHAWVDCHFTDLLDYLALLWSLDSIDWP
jgi:hypothetical protein